jgi:hypothetical protein
MNKTVIFLSSLLALMTQPSHAQYLTPNTGGTVGGACTNGTFTWPDSNGYFLKCVSGAWVKLSSGLSNLSGSLCATPSGSVYPNDQRTAFVQSIDSHGTVTCAQPHAYSAFSGNTNNLQTAASTTYYFAVNGANEASSSVLTTYTTDTAAITRTLVSRAGTIQNLYVVADVTNSTGATNTYTVMKNGSAQTLTCSVTHASNCNDTTHSFTVSPGDMIGVKVVTDSGAQLVRSAWAVELSY